MGLNPAEREKVEGYQTMLGLEAGRLALAMDQLTDAMAALGQHKVYCRVEKGPRIGEPPLDLVDLLDTLQKAKTLVQQTLLQLKDKEAPKGPALA